MDLQRYRPTDMSPTAVQRALDAASADEAAIEARAEEAKQKRDALLLDGDAKALKLAEEALLTARGDCERLAAIQLQLTARLKTARDAAALGQVTAAASELSAANTALTEFWHDSGAEMLQLLEAGWTLTRNRMGAQIKLRAAQMNAINCHPDVADAASTPSATQLADEAQVLVEIYDAIGHQLHGTPIDPIIPPPRKIDDEFPLPKLQFEGSDLPPPQSGRRNPVASLFNGGDR